MLCDYDAKMFNDTILDFISSEMSSESFIITMFNNNSSTNIDNMCHLYFKYVEVCPSSLLFRLFVECCDINKLVEGTTPLHCYLMNEGFESSVLKNLLKEYGMNTFNVRDSDGHIPLHKYLTHNEVENDIFDMLSDSIDSFSEYKNILIHYIYSRLDLKPINYYVLYKLLRKGADPNYVDDRGNTFLHYFCIYMSTYEKTSFNKMHREKKFIKELVKYGADINKVNNIGNTPLHNYVSQYDISPRIIFTLLSLGADLTIQNNYRLTPIMEYIKCEYIEYNTLLMLINWYESKYRKLEKEEGQHLLHLFIRHNDINDLNILSYLLKKFDMKNDEYYNDITPLHNACIACNVDIMSYLVYIGCNINLPTKDNKSIFDIISTQPDNIIYRNCIIYHLIRNGLDISLSVIKSLLSIIPYLTTDYYVRYIITYCILMNNNFIKEYNNQCLNHNYRELFVNFITFDYIDNIVSDCVNDINRLKQENYYNILRYEDIKYYNLVNDIYVTNKTFPMYTDIIENCNIRMKRKYKLINTVIDKIYSISSVDNNKLSLLPPEIIREIISKLSEYDLNTILYGRNHLKHYYKFN
ncbi:CPXV220 protein [Cowpox virus]|uniref:CPXV220 protein n=1 Tax=Cowpox virus TaxID=10243 RepID=U5TKI4_COWPX|nr:CPXV220 protein [Cowpox virus]AGY99614.1 CPXV220 protein [Cowpox virus]AGZ00044.1 CPXV220 protein [Cowpox virus]AGZ01522.1 CPXV220 protein [Cowpox virus]AZY88976.1 CPXV220 protein [Cowpox virus]